MGFKADVFTEHLPVGRSGERVHIRAQVSHLDVPEIILGSTHLSMEYSEGVYDYDGREYTPKQFKRLEKKLHHDLLEEALTLAKRNLTKLQKAKF